VFKRFSHWLCVLALLGLAACASVPRLLPAPPANLTQACTPVPDLPEPANLGDLLRADIELIGLYKECAARHQALSEWAK